MKSQEVNADPNFKIVNYTILPFNEPKGQSLTLYHNKSFNKFQVKSIPGWQIGCGSNDWICLLYIRKHFGNKSGKLSQDTPVLPQVVKLGHAPDKIQVWKTTKGTNSKIKQARVMIPVHCTSPLWDLSTHEIS